MTGLGPVELLIIVLFSVVGLLVLAGFIAVPVLILRNARAARRAGYDPTTVQTDLAVQAARSRLLAPQQSLEDRLRELDDLRDRGVITAEEHAAARSRALSA